MVNVDKLLAFESGELDESETVALFQELVDTGLAWQLQGFYGRMTVDLIKQGYVIDHTAEDRARCIAEYSDDDIATAWDDQMAVYGC